MPWGAEAQDNCDPEIGLVDAACLTAKKPRPVPIQKTRPPTALRLFLQQNPNFHLLSPVDVADHLEFTTELDSISLSLTAEDVQSRKRANFKYFQPFVIADANRDGRKDLVAVIVNGNRFNVIAFHGRTRAFSVTPRWIIRDDPEIITGVSVIPKMGIMPRYCVACDANPVYRWTGSEYDADAYAPGETVCIDAGSLIYAKADITSPVIHRAERAVEGTVTQMGARERSSGNPERVYRWHRVQLKSATALKGFVQGANFIGGFGNCG